MAYATPSHSLPRDPMTEVLRWVLRVGLSLAFFLPLVVGSKFFFPFIVLKHVAFRMLVEVLLVAYVALALREQRYRPTWSPLTVAVLAYLGITTLTSFTGVAVESSLWGNYERMGGLVFLWHLGAFFFLLVNTLRDPEDFRFLLTSTVFAAVLMSLFAFGQWLQVPFLLKSSGGARLTGTIGNATYLAAYLLFHLFLGGYLWFKTERFNLRQFFWLLLGLDALLVGYDLVLSGRPNTISLFASLASAPVLVALVAALHGGALLALLYQQRQRWIVRAFLAGLLFLYFFIYYQTQTRGAILGLLVGVLVLAAALAVLRWRTRTGKAGLAVLALGLAAPVLLYLARGTPWVLGDPTLRRLTSISLSDVTSQSRLDTWQASWRGWMEDPIRFLIGYGQENYSVVFNRHFPPRIFKDLGSQIWFDRAHNIIFDVGVTSGLIGLAGYLALYAVAAWLLWRYWRTSGDFTTAVMPVALLAAYFTQNLFVFDTLDSSILFMLVLAAVAAWTAESAPVLFPAPPARAHARGLLTPGSAVAVSLLAVAVAYSLYAFNIRLLAANHKIYLALLTFPTLNVPAQRELFREAIDASVTGRFEARQQLATFALNAVRSEAVDPRTAKEVLEYALAELRKSIAEEPSNIRHHLFFASVANRAGVILPDAPRQALAVLDRPEVIALSPTRPQIYTELAQANLVTGNTQVGLEFYQRAQQLAPQVVELNVDLTVAYVLSRQREAAYAQLATVRRELKQTFTPDQYLRVTRAADRAQQYEVAIRFFQELLADYPPKADYYAQLAVVYAKAGDFTNAKAAAAKALELDPNARADYEAFLKQLQDREPKTQ